MKKFLLFFLGFVYLILTLAFSFGFFYNLNHLPAEELLTDSHYYCFGFGLCAFPSIILTGMSVGFYCDLIKLFPSCKEKNSAA